MPSFVRMLVALAGLVAGCATPASLVRLQSPSDVIAQPANDLPPLPPAAPVAPAIAARPGDQLRSTGPDLSGMSSIARNRTRSRGEEPGDDDKADFPDLFDDPLKKSNIPKSERDPFLFGPLMNLIYEDTWGLEKPEVAREKRLRRQSKIDIRDPDPDTANFPNGAYTLPKGRMYIENSPVGLYGKSANTPKTYQWEYLVRYGLTDNLEFRIFSNGLTVQKGTKQVTGYSPLAFDFKVNLWEENRKYFIPAMGVEMYIQTPFGSAAFDQGTAPSLNLLFDQSLPFDIGFEYNFGMTGVQNQLHQNKYQFSYSWSFQRQIVPDFDAFVHGFYNATGLPRLPVLAKIRDRQQIQDERSIPTVNVVGAGAIWTVNDRLAVFGSYNFGTTVHSPNHIALLGFAIAF